MKTLRTKDGKHQVNIYDNNGYGHRTTVDFLHEYEGLCGTVFPAHAGVILAK